MDGKIFALESSQLDVVSTGKKFDFLSDKDIWEAFKSGDEGAFIQIYNAYFGELCNFGIQYVPLNVVEDVIQDLFIDLRKRRSKLPQLRHTIRLFLFQCLKNRILNLLKKERKVHGDIPEFLFGIVPCPETVIILDQDRQLKMKKLERALAHLKEKEREAIYYYFYMGMSYEEVREMLGFQDVKSARNLIYKIVTSLRKSFLCC